MKPTVLVADDNVSYVSQVGLYLSRHGFNVLHAFTPEDVYLMAKNHPLDLVLLDIRFTVSGSEGFDICRTLKADSATQRILVVLVTAYPEIDCEHGLDAGADGFFRASHDHPALKLHLMTLLKARDSAYRVARLEAERTIAEGYAHDLKNALTLPFTILGQFRGDRIAEMAPLLPLIQERTGFASLILRAMQERGRGEAAHVPISPVQIVRYCAHLIKEICKMRNVELGFSIQECVVPSIKVPYAEVVICIMELLNNSLREFEGITAAATPWEVFRITLSVQTGGSDVYVGVADNGRGILEGQEDKIFEDGHTTRRELGGTGIGLSLVRKRLASCGAQIALRKTAQRGACFELRFPSHPIS
jgi:signal transduction histidine kinase